MPYRQLAYLPNRRSTRIEQSVHIIVRGLDVSRTPYEEKVSTLAVNCHGCRYLSRNNVLRGDIATLEVVDIRDGRSTCSTQVHVMSVQPLGTGEMLFYVAVELESPQNIWGIASPLEDWPEIPELARAVGCAPELRVVPRLEEPKDHEAKLSSVETIPPSHSLETGAMSSLPPLLAQLVANLREQIGTSKAARDTVARDGDEFLYEFRARLESEAKKVLGLLVTASMEELARRAEELRRTHEAAARNMYESWIRKFKQEMTNSDKLHSPSSAIDAASRRELHLPS